MYVIDVASSAIIYTANQKSSTGQKWKLGGENRSRRRAFLCKPAAASHSFGRREILEPGPGSGVSSR